MPLRRVASQSGSSSRPIWLVEDTPAPASVTTAKASRASCRAAGWCLVGSGGGGRASMGAGGGGGVGGGGVGASPPTPSPPPLRTAAEPVSAADDELGGMSTSASGDVASGEPPEIGGNISSGTSGAEEGCGSVAG